MTNREIDSLVAEKVMGWKSARKPYGNWWAKDGLDNPDAKEFIPKDSFSPSEKISFAWEVVEKILSQNDGEGPAFELRTLKGRPAPGKNWAKFYRMTGGPFEAYAPEPEMAICLAALKSVGVEVKP